MNVEIWDVSGQDKFRSTTRMYFRDADACILVYDLTDRESFLNLSKVWIPDLRDKGPEKVTLGLVGNKFDLSENIG